LKKLAVLDKIGESISATKVLTDDAKKKRQVKEDISNPASDSMSKSILLTEEEVAEIEKDYFINSKSGKKRKGKDDIWD